MIADMYVIETGDAILMDLERAVTARVREHLAQFVFSEDVEVTDVSGSTDELGIFGPDAAQVVNRVFESHGSVPTTADLESLRVLENRTSNWSASPEHSESPVTIVRRDDLGGLGFDLWIGAEQSDALTAALLSAGALDVDPEAADVCRIENGRPLFGRDMTTDTIPLEAGIEDRAISLTKGCYVGQEIIIRVLHRGQGRVARRLVGLTLDPTASVPGVGSTIHANDREIGVVTSAAMSPALGHPIALGYVHRDFVEPGIAVTVVSGDQALPAVVTQLPFVDV